MTDNERRPGYQGFFALTPEVRKPMQALAEAVVRAGLEPDLIELIKVRASQLNGCAFCIRFHVALARKAGVGEEKLDLLPAWPEARCYSPRERAALAWAEALTADPARAAEPAAYAAVRAEFSDTEVAHLSVAIGTINQWNRIAIAMGFEPQ